MSNLRKKFILCVYLLTVTVFISVKPVYGQTASINVENVHQWITKHFSKNETPPFSFVYDGRSSETFIKKWKYSSYKEESKDPDVEKFFFTYLDKQTGLEIKCHVTGYLSFNTVEWVLNIRNSSTSANTPVIEKLNVVDENILSRKTGKFILHHSNGTSGQKNDFIPFDDTLVCKKAFSLVPGDHGSSSNSAFPFFNIELPDGCGVIAAIGWSGKWFADVEQQTDKFVSLKAGMLRTHFVLYPGEEVRTPSIALLFWKSDRMTGHNNFRRFILAYHTRKINGQIARLPLSFGFEYGDVSPFDEYNSLTDFYAIAIARRTKQFNIVPDVFWLDAGWYTGCGDWYSHAGNWTVEKERFPNGLKPVSDAIHSVGAKFMVWFEPERVYEGTMIYNEHPEFLIKLPGKKSAEFNLGNEKARLWLTDYISNFIKEQGVDYYRQDHNFNPQPYWQADEKPDRTGINEIRHIEGLYAYWDSLLVRFPNLIIDNCASGGNRLDLETVSRSSPLWRTDYKYGEPDGQQCHTYGLNFYLPLHGTGVFYNSTPYYLRSGLSSGIVVNWHLNNTMSLPVMQKAVKDLRRLQPYYLGDYYPLTSAKNIIDDNIWLAYQMNRPETGDGIIVAFRRKECSTDTLFVKLKGLDINANYELFNEDTGIKTLLTGRELLDGITLTQKDKPGSILIDYIKVK